MEKLSYIFEKVFEAGKLELTKRGIKFDVVDDMTIAVANTDSVVLTEFSMKYHMDDTTGIRIMNKVIDKKIESLYDKLHALDPNVLTRNIVQRAQESKNKLRACGRCDSKVATKYIIEAYCPVCGSSDFLYTNTDLKKFKALDCKRAKIIAEIEVHKAKKEAGIKKAIQANSSSKNWFWYVGGLCSD